MKKGFILSITDCPFQSQFVSQTKKLINTVFEVIEPGMTNLHDCAISCNIMWPTWKQPTIWQLSFFM